MIDQPSTSGRAQSKHAKPLAPAAKTGRRRCLMCGQTFRSEGAHNRICPDCKTTKVWKSGSDFDMPATLGASGRTVSGRFAGTKQ